MPKTLKLRHPAPYRERVSYSDPGTLPSGVPKRTKRTTAAWATRDSKGSLLSSAATSRTGNPLEDLGAMVSGAAGKARPSRLNPARRMRAAGKARPLSRG